MQLIEGKCQNCLCFAFFTSIAAAAMVALAIFWALPGAICEGGFPTVISLRGRQHFWICSFLVSTVWRSQHKISEYLVDGISSALKSWVFISHNVAFFEYWVCQEKQWISGYHCQNYKNLDAYPKRCSSASLLNSFFHFFFFFAGFCISFCIVLFLLFLLIKNVLHFFSELKWCQSVISIMMGKSEIRA